MHLLEPLLVTKKASFREACLSVNCTTEAYYLEARGSNFYSPASAHHRCPLAGGGGWGVKAEASLEKAAPIR